MQVDDEILTLSTTVQVVHGVALSQDHTGVTARIPFSGARISVFFDGYTAHVTGMKNKLLSGQKERVNSYLCHSTCFQSYDVHV